MDSTYKTNRMGYELFGVIANFNGCGFPIAYMFLGVNDARVPEYERAPSRMDMIERFFRTLRRAGFAPVFMFSDKDLGQINGIENVFGANALRLCLWHIQRAVKLRLAGDKVQNVRYDAATAQNDFDFVNVSFLPPQDRAGKICPDISRRDEIVSMIRRHYDYHPDIPIDRGIHGSML